LIFAVGTRVVTLKDIVGPNSRTLHPRGSQAYGLADDDSDNDRRGFYLPPAELRLSLLPEPPIGAAAVNDQLVRIRLQTQGER
jgi:hypothetical protein